MAKCTSETVHRFEGVKPACVEGRFFNTHIDTASCVLVIQEFYDNFFREPVVSKEKSFQKDNFTVYLIPVSASVHQLRIVGRPVCIGCRANTLIIQFITSNSLYIKFLYANLALNICYMFDDTAQYFKYDDITVSPLECLISPDMNFIILRLPQRALRPRSSALQVLLKSVESTCISIPVGTQLIFHDQKFLAMAFDPYKPAHRYTAAVHEYCDYIRLKVVDMNNMNAVIKTTAHYIGNRPYSSHGNGDLDEGISTHVLQQSSMIFCRSADVVIIFYAYIDTVDISHIRLVQYCTETLQCISNMETTLTQGHVPITLAQCDLLFPVLSINDSQLSVWYMKQKTAPVKCVMEVLIKKSLQNLSSLARSAILRNVHCCEMELLPIPTRLKMYLRFE